MSCVFFFSSRIRHTRCALVTGVQTCALPICPALEVMAVVPCDHAGWLEKNAMQAGRARFVARFHHQGLAGRIRLFAPEVEKDGKTAPVKVHAKVMVVDDRSLRVGSANLSNRSMGFDTECDLILLARDGE